MPLDPHRHISEERSTLSGWVTALPLLEVGKSQRPEENDEHGYEG
jgi:hypothetical protein